MSLTSGVRRALARSRWYGAALATFLCSASSLFTGAARAWILPEHVRITEQAIARLPPSDAELLQTYWTSAISRLPELCARADQTLPGATRPDASDTSHEALRPKCVHLAALPALAADHSCSAAELRAILESKPGEDNMFLDLLAVARRTEIELENAATHTEHLDIWLRQNYELESYDENYTERADANTAHFQLPRSAAEESLRGYLSSVFGAGVRVNGIALYANYHAAALRLASAEHGSPTPESILRVILLEAYALHFLQDSFAAGHAVGARPPRELYKGTHDYYSEHGIAARTWSAPNTTYHAYGDSFMTEKDLSYASEATSASLHQVIASLSGQALDDGGIIGSRPWVSEFSSCAESNVPLGLESLAAAAPILRVLERTIMPALSSPAPPQFRLEIGPFLRGGAVLDGTVAKGWAPDEIRWQARGVLSVGAGLGFDGLVTRAQQPGLFLAAVGAFSMGRTLNLGAGFTLQVPFAYVPLDALVWVWPLLGGKVTSTSVRALQGPWGLHTRRRIGNTATLQIVLGRRATLVFYPYYSTHEVGESFRWELTLPFLVVGFEHEYAYPLGHELELELSLHVGHSARDQPARGDEGATSVGVTLSFSNATRLYLQ